MILPLNGKLPHTIPVDPARLTLFAERTPTPWANGRGTTTELGSGRVEEDGRLVPIPGNGEIWDWRVSIATIDRVGPFSRLAGISRILMPLDADLVGLSIDGTDHRVARHSTVTFDGAAVVGIGAVRQPLRVLNVMARTTRVVPQLARVIAIGSPAAVALSHGVAVGLGDAATGSARSLGFGDSLIVRPGERLPQATLAWIGFARKTAHDAAPTA